MASWIEYTEPEWDGLRMNLSVDHAYLRIKAYLNKTFWLYSLSEECYTCPYTRIRTISPGRRSVTNLDVSRSLLLKVFDEDVGVYAFENETAYCTVSPDMEEFGVYSLSINSNRTCGFATDKEPVSIYLPLLLVIILLLSFILSTKVSLFLWRKYRSSPHEESNDRNPEPPVKKRLMSLDAFRGMSIVLMIFVNSGGGKYWWIEHAVWNGLHVADIVFPCFLWIMGVCIPISIKSQLTKGASKAKMCQRILWRSTKLFLIGLCLNSMSGPNLENLRIMGVLQRFGVAYLICATLHAIFFKMQHTPPQTRLGQMLFDFKIMKVELIANIILIVAYLGIVFGWQVPDCPRGYMGPGGKHSMAAYPNCIGGVIGYIDKNILGEMHIYQHPTAKYVYNSKPFDPEGIFGCLLTVVHVLLGVHCGVILTTFSEWKSRISRWCIWSIVLGLMAGILCSFSKEDGWIPVNKNLWSLSYVLATASIAFLLLSLCYYFIDIKTIWSGYPFVEAGMNAIIMYIGHSVLHKMLPWHWRVGNMNTHFLLLTESVWNTVIWVLIALYLFKNNIFYNL